ncbi:MAG TPA: hypothetical protein VGG51_09340 [Candidatus Cybelea sp.]|jgi:hypothetical protein
MNISSTLRRALGLAATIALLVGCNGGPLSVPSSGVASPAHSTPQGISFSTLTSRDAFPKAAHLGYRRSWISPDAKKKRLLYVSDWYMNVVAIFELPSGKPLGLLANDLHQPQGLCADGSHVFVTSTAASQILEYDAASEKPIATLADPGQFPVGCSYDKTTGNLAVGNVDSTSDGKGNVAVYAKAKGSPATDTCSSIFRYYFPGYDAEGNLYIDGQTSLSSGSFAFCGLRKGSRSMQNISLDQSIDYPGQVQWDGTYVTVSDQNNSTVYRFTIKEKRGALKGSTSLEDADDCTQNWIEKNTVYCPASGSAAALIYGYPAGGPPLKILRGISWPIGATVVRYKK